MLHRLKNSEKKNILTGRFPKKSGQTKWFNFHMKNIEWHCNVNTVNTTQQFSSE